MDETEDGLRTTAVGTLVPVESGKPIMGDMVSLEPRPGTPLFDCTTVVECPHKPKTSSGPAQVANEAYRENFDRIFNKPKDEELAN